jgi:hypothetical protein
MTELQLVARELEKALCPEDVFGVDIKRSFRQLVKIVHPDFNKNALFAHETMERLNELKSIADARVEAGTWGTRLPFPWHEVVEIGGYAVAQRPLVGDVADVYVGIEYVVKVARNSDDNDLMRAERAALSLLASKVNTKVAAAFPTLRGHFQQSNRDTNVLRKVPDGFLPAEEVHRRMPSVDGRALVWMFKRLLVALEWAHHCGLVHGAVLPSHVMLYPDNDGTTTNPHPCKHTVRLLDWCYSVRYAERTRLSSWVPAWTAHYPPELLLKQSVTPASDIFMAASLIAYLAGGIDGTEAPLRAVIERCVLADVTKRYQTVAHVFTDWNAAAQRIYGPPKWVDFNLPE